MATRITTGKVRFSYEHVFKPWAQEEGQTPKYSVCLLIPKEDRVTIKKISDAVSEAIDAGVASKWQGKQPKNLKLPLRDGDLEKADDHPEYAGMMFLNANNSDKPIVVDANREDILDSTEFYSGCWGRASLSFFAYDSHGNRGVGVSLRGVQKLTDGEPLGGGRASADEFDDDFDGGFSEDF